MRLDETQLKKLQIFRDSVKEETNKKEETQLVHVSTYYDVIDRLDSARYHMVYDAVNRNWLKVQGYLFIKKGYVCPLIFNHTYMLRSLHIMNKELILSDNKVGFMFAQVGNGNINQKINNSVIEYNKKVQYAITEFPRNKQLFDSKSIIGFKIL